MNKFSQSLVLAVAVLISSQSFAAQRIILLECGSLKNAQGQMLIGVGYSVQIRTGLDTHKSNPNGSIGVLVTNFQLISKVVSPSAKPQVQDLTLVSRGSNGEYNLANSTSNVVVNNGMSQASLLLSNGATGSCN